ncbi:MAG: hypothetical protein IJ806_11405 [Ruminococcus sp.]|nr:hypothetical protein [Ruminococcus sp.]
MNEAERINRQFSKSFLRNGIIILTALLLLFVYKSVKGYEKVTEFKTVAGCSIKTEIKVIHNSKGRDSNVYYVTVDCPQESLHFKASVTKSYFRAFQNYRADYVSFFKNENGQYFPTYRLNCSLHEAEREYRAIEEPILWYILYGVILVIGLINVSVGLSARRTKQNYTGERTVPVSTFSGADREDALEAMAVARIRREKAEERMAQNRRHRYRRF